jgi:hypothetical protein
MPISVLAARGHVDRHHEQGILPKDLGFMSVADYNAWIDMSISLGQRYADACGRYQSRLGEMRT